MFCATKQSILRETGDEVCETDAESKNHACQFCDVNISMAAS